jgi:hypothetical protein
MSLKAMGYTTGTTHVTRWYEESDPIWSLPKDKQERKLIADVQRDLTVEADMLVRRPVTVRG